MCVWWGRGRCGPEGLYVSDMMGEYLDWKFEFEGVEMGVEDCIKADEILSFKTWEKCLLNIPFPLDLTQTTFYLLSLITHTAHHARWHNYSTRQYRTRTSKRVPADLRAPFVF